MKDESCDAIQEREALRAIVDIAFEGAQHVREVFHQGKHGREAHRLIVRMQAIAMCALDEQDGSIRPSHDAVRRALELFVNFCTYPVSEEINPRGYNWKPENDLDYARAEAIAALSSPLA